MDTIDISINLNNSEKSIQTVKELRSYIKELRDQLVTTEQGTTEWEDTVKDLTDAVGKLNSVMKAEKEQVESNEGSYNAINDRMKELMKVYKSMALVTDEDKQKQKELAVEINSLNDQLKQMDADVGVFSRNVGNYSDAFKGLKDTADILHTTSEQLGDGFNALSNQMNLSSDTASSVADGFSALGSVFEAGTGILQGAMDVFDKMAMMYELSSDMLDIFKTKKAAVTSAEKADTAAKKANTAATVVETTATQGATAAQNSFTAALLANPITLIITAIVLLIANLDNLVKMYRAVVDWLTGANEEAERNEKITNNLVTANEKLNSTMESQNKDLERHVKLMQAQGKSEQEIIKYRMKQNELQRQAIRQQQAENQAQLTRIKLLEAEHPGKYTEQIKSLTKVINDNWKAYRDLQDKMKDYQNDMVIADINSKKKSTSGKTTAVKKGVSDEQKLIQEQVKNNKTLYEQDLANFENVINEKTKLAKEFSDESHKVQAIFKQYEENINEVIVTNKKQSSLFNEIGASSSRFIIKTIHEIKDVSEEQVKALNKSKTEQENLIKDYTAKIKELQGLISVTKDKKEKNRLLALLGIDQENLKNAQEQLGSMDIFIKESTEKIYKLRDESIKDLKSQDTFLNQEEDPLKMIIGVGNTTLDDAVDEAEKITKRLNEDIAALKGQFDVGNLDKSNFIVGITKVLNDFDNLRQQKLQEYKSDNEHANNLLAYAFGISKESKDIISSAMSEQISDIITNMRDKVTKIEEGEPKSDKKINLLNIIFGIDEGEDVDYGALKDYYKNLENQVQQNIDELKTKLKDSEHLTEEEKQTILDEIKDLEDKKRDIRAQAAQTEKDEEQQRAENIKKIYQGVVSSINSLGTMFSARMNLIKQRAENIKKDSKLSEEQQKAALEKQQKEYNKAFEANKKVEYANTVISTATAAMQAYKSMAGIPIVGPALGAAAAALAVTTGLYQLKTIKESKPDSISDLNSSSGTDSSSISDITSSIPDINSILNYDQKSTDLNNEGLTDLQALKSSSSTRVYVLESDITETQNKKRTQVAESRF